MGEKLEKEKIKYFRPLKPEAQVHHPIIAFDTEDDQKGNFVFGSIFDGRQNLDFKEKEEMARYLNNCKNVLIVAFNLEYDLNNLEPYIQAQRIYGHAGLIGARVGKYRVKALDVARHLDGRLEDLMPLVGMQKLPLSRLEERCRSDARATYLLARMLEDFYFREGSKFNYTVAGCSMEIFRRRFFCESWKVLSPQKVELQRKAYYGGRVEVYDLRSQPVKIFDLNSAYLWAMRTYEFPRPDRTFWDLSLDWRKWKCALIEAKVKVPESLFYPPLPYRRNGKLLFPVGEFSGWWTNWELRKAEEVGVEIQPLKVLVFPVVKPYFRKFADWVWKERQKAKEEGNLPRELMIKKVGNSLYGKWGEMIGEGFWGKLNEIGKKMIELVGMPIDIKIVNGEEYIVVPGEREHPVPHTFPVLSAFITSAVRIRLYETVLQTSPVYCDTDSVFIPIGNPDPDDVGSGLGQWKNEGVFEFRPFRAKAYQKGEQWKIKGIPKTADIRFEPNRVLAQFQKPIRFREGLRRGIKFNFWLNVEKEIDLLDDKREIRGELTYPIRIEEKP